MVRSGSKVFGVQQGLELQKNLSFFCSIKLALTDINNIVRLATKKMNFLQGYRTFATLMIADIMNFQKYSNITPMKVSKVSQIWFIFAPLEEFYS